MKMMNICCTVALLGLSPMVLANDGLPLPQSGQKLLQKFDLNQDGVITREEAVQVRNEKFNQADADKNGAVTLSEWQAAQAQRRAAYMAQRFGAMDGDNNGFISQDEFGQGKNPQGRGGNRAARFAQIDSNGDQQISPDELAAQHAARQAKKGDWGQKMFQTLDADQNGEVTLAEMQAIVPLFERFDANQDGKIDGDELQKVGGQCNKRAYK
jgi:Ca2+-binding EF-hand superfamily protein